MRTEAIRFFTFISMQNKIVVWNRWHQRGSISYTQNHNSVSCCPSCAFLPPVFPYTFKIYLKRRTAFNNTAFFSKDVLNLQFVRIAGAKHPLSTKLDSNVCCPKFPLIKGKYSQTVKLFVRLNLNIDGFQRGLLKH